MVEEKLYALNMVEYVSQESLDFRNYICEDAGGKLGTDLFCT